MKQPRQRFRRLLRRRGKGPNRLAEQTEIAKTEAREVARREREPRRRRLRLRRRRGAGPAPAEANLTAERRPGSEAGRLKRVRVPGLRPDVLIATLITLIARPIAAAATAIARLLRPAVAAIGDGLGWIAPPIVQGLLLAVAIPAALLARVLEAIQAVGGWVGRRLRAIAGAVGGALEAIVTPVRALAAVVVAAAVLLAISQFTDYHGVAVSAPQYAGEVGTIADAPLTDRETAGSAHLYVLAFGAAAAIVLAVLTLRGSWKLGRVIGLIGLAGIAVSLIVDLPQGLDAGRAGISYEGSEARLIEGFWAQLSASAALLVCGPLLGLHARRPAGEERQRHRRRRLRPAGGGLRRGTAELRAET